MPFGGDLLRSGSDFVTNLIHGYDLNAIGNLPANWTDVSNPANAEIGIAVLVAVPYLVLSFAAFRYPSPGVMIGWILTSSMLFLSFFTDVTLRPYWLGLILTVVLVGVAAFLQEGP